MDAVSAPETLPGPGTRAVVAMSGGVDSSTTAALLMEQGYEVVGITMQLYDVQKTAMQGRAGGTCCSLDDVHDARRVAEHLGIPFYVVNFQEAFQALVVDNLVEEYLGGRTPNPCVRCNEFMKFRLLLDRAVALGGAFLATGHYARVQWDAGADRWRLRRAVHAAKDQSYFLYPVGQRQLSRLRFPLGEMTKDEVRAHAARFALPTAQKRESQDVCFIAGESYRQFLAREAPERLPGPGEIVDLQGTPVGRHDGYHRFTVGQRRGIGVAAPDPQYVVRIDPERNRVIIGGRADLGVLALTAARVRWVGGAPPPPGRPVEVKVRYASAPVPGTVRMLDGRRAEVRLQQGERGVSPGQTVVFYAGDEVLGGGVIEGVVAPAAAQVAEGAA